VAEDAQAAWLLVAPAAILLLALPVLPVRADQARELGVVGEGIEREDQLLALGELGCEMGQGYLPGRPVELSRGVAFAPPRAPAFTG
jgi:predicted signal transduction protein with EAL and GGDEF domain